jgi:hypothetical protein
MPLAAFTKAAMADVPLFAGDDRLKLSEYEQKLRQEIAEELPEAVQLLGCKGKDVFTSRLGYTRFNQLYVLPVWHMLLRGVLRDFWIRAVGDASPYLTSDAK